MNQRSLAMNVIALTVLAVLPVAAHPETRSARGAAVPLSKGETNYVSRIAPRYGKLAGSSANLERLVYALRAGKPVQLSEAVAATATSNSPEAGRSAATTFTPATRPMGYGDVTRTLELASRQLARVGIKHPTSRQLLAALNGGTVATAQGSIVFPGVVKLRSEGMGWAKIAKTIGVHPETMRSAVLAQTPPASAVTATSHGSTSEVNRPSR
jgi:hypothetical protein